MRPSRFFNAIPHHAYHFLALILYTLAGQVSLVNTAFGDAMNAAPGIIEPRQPPFHFRAIESKELDSISEVFSIAQDNRGFMWFGGEKGLARYDGHTVKIYRHDDNNTTSLSSSRINRLIVDHEGLLWVATDQGIDRHNIKTNDFTHFAYEAGSSGSNNIVSLMVDRAGQLWFGSDKGLNRLNAISGKLEQVALPVGEKTSEVKNVRALLEDKQGMIWVEAVGGIGRLNPATMVYTYYQRPEGLTNPNDAVIRLYEDTQGRLWIGTMSNGFSRFDRTTETFMQYKHDPVDPASIGSDEIRGIFEDRDHNLWVANYGGGLNRLNPEVTFSLGDGKLAFDHYMAQTGDKNSIATNKIGPIYEDHAGGLWLGHFPSGVSSMNKYAATFQNFLHDPQNVNSLSDSGILSVVEAEHGNLWVGTEKGLNHIDRHSGVVTRYPTNPKGDAYSKSGLPVDAVLALMLDSKGDLWIGTWLGGLSRFNPATKTFTHYRSIPGDQNGNAVWSFYEDAAKNIWVGSTSALFRYEREKDSFVRYEHSDNDSNSILKGYIFSMQEDSHGNFWIGSETGLNLMNRETDMFQHFIHKNTDLNSIGEGYVFSLAEDKEGSLWVGLLGGGISKMLLGSQAKQNSQVNSGQFKNYHVKDGLPDEFVTGILVDEQGFLWLSTGYGLAQFNTKTEQFHNYNKDYGLPGNIYNRTGHVKTSKGELVFGSTTGLTIFDPATLFKNDVAPPIVFTDFKLFNKSAFIGAEGSPLVHAITETKTLTLNHEQSVFSFEFSALNYLFPEANKYAYKLEGFDKAWTFSGAEHAATYTNLDAGNYVFHIKGANNEGVWNEEGTKINLIVLPPWWKTWWAYTLYVLAFASVIVRIIYAQYAKRQLAEEQNRLLEIKVLERTAEIREKNKDIQTMLSNMHQGLFTILPNGNIHPEYSHFLEDIFETTVVSGRNAITLLFEKANLGSDELDQLKVSVNSIIGEDEMNYSFNSHLLIEEYEAVFEGGSKFLSLDWNPVVVDDIVEKLMVSVRDVTLLKEMEGEARSKKRELDIVSQLLNIPAKKYLDFVSSVKVFIGENRTKIEESEQHSEPIIALLFRNMHTIKGNARTYNLVAFCDVVHEVESVYSELKSKPEGVWDRELLLRDLVRVENILQEYEDVYYNVLGRGKSELEARDKNGFWADSQAIETIQSSVDRAHQEYPVLQKTRPLLPIQTLLNRVLSTPMSDVLSDIISSLPSIALQLNKEVPKVVVDDNQVRIKFNATELMTNIFAHILRNAVDHGIETAAVRLHAGKPSAGTIEVRAEPKPQSLCIHIKDDGQGVNIDRLFNKGVEVGKWTVQDKPSYSDIAHLIFASGVSTKEQVTTISGRGVGMDAVKEFLLAKGGNISLQLLGANANGANIGQGIMVPFELIVELPLGTFTLLS